ncbi:MAG: hypothetical protein HYX47_18900 [Burkholderiales bacterium]|nr:hypothetical protein [Burkholderiales bacterium]
MLATLPRSLLSGLRAAPGKALAVGVAALLLFAGYRQIIQAQHEDADARGQAFAVPAWVVQENCIEGANLFHDVRWAVACQAQADQGLGSGIADCELPDTHASRLYALLEQAENRCRAEAKAIPLR